MRSSISRILVDEIASDFPIMISGWLSLLISAMAIADLPPSQRVDAVFLDHLSQDIRGTNSSAVWRCQRTKAIFHLILNKI